MIKFIIYVSEAENRNCDIWDSFNFNACDYAITPIFKIEKALEGLYDIEPQNNIMESIKELRKYGVNHYSVNIEKSIPNTYYYDDIEIYRR